MSFPDLFHYSADPLDIDQLVPAYQVAEVMPHQKPNGLWVTTDDEDNWKAWSLANEFRLQDLMYKNRVVLKPDAKLLHIEGDEALMSFHSEYLGRSERFAKALEALPPMPSSVVALLGTDFEHDIASGIKWYEVAQKYDGILIAPYVWSLRLEYKWYYSWDCSSGCIWNTNCIASVNICPT